MQTCCYRDRDNEEEGCPSNKVEVKRGSNCLVISTMSKYGADMQIEDISDKILGRQCIHYIFKRLKLVIFFV